MKNLYNLRVASIQDNFRVVINAGSDDGVDEDMEFVIYSPGEEIIDPETGKSLGKLEKVKGRIEIVHVQPTMSVGRSSQFTDQKFPVQNALSALSSFGINGERQYDVRKVRRKLDTVEVGDFVRRLS